MAPWVLELFNREMPTWLSKATPIVSTDFMRPRCKSFILNLDKRRQVVPVAPTSIGQLNSERNDPGSFWNSKEVYIMPDQHRQP